jgi:N-acetylmuramoyl-L-alanine amidase
MCVKCYPARRDVLRWGAGLVAAVALRAAPARASRRLPLVMLDPGHGGYDPGAIAPDGVYEKDITLASSLTLRRALLATGRYRVEMTRSTDTFITLDGRVQAAVDSGANLFLAMHCDHLPKPKLRGASVFTLSETASDGLAAGLASDENSADVSPDFPGVSPQVANILASLESRATRIGSATLAQDIQDSFAGVVPLLPDPHRSANFAVLRDPSTPSTLLEMGCLTNPLDEALLKSPAHRRLMAARLTRAIDMYFADHAGDRVAG